MTDLLRQRFIELLEEEIARLRDGAKAWSELQKHGAHLEDLNGRVIATAGEKLNQCLERETELQALIDQVRSH